MIIGAFENERAEMQSGMEEEGTETKDYREMNEWTLQVVISTIGSLKSQLNGGEPIEPEDVDLEELKSEE